MDEDVSALFSERLGIRRPPHALIQEDAPEPLRNAFINLLGRGVGGSLLEGWPDLYSAFEMALDKWTPNDRYVISFNKIGALLKSCEWYEFYDLVETTIALPMVSPDIFINEFNSALCRNYVGYEIRDGKVEKVGARGADTIIAHARAILRDEDLAGADEQFRKAIGFFNQRPDPDLENCVKDSVGSVEALARELLKKPSIELNDAIREIGQEKGVHKALQQMVEKLYAYRGDAPGAGHGKTGAKAPVTHAESEFVLHSSAACIVLLARLYDIVVE